MHYLYEYGICVVKDTPTDLGVVETVSCKLTTVLLTADTCTGCPTDSRKDWLCKRISAWKGTHK